MRASKVSLNHNNGPMIFMNQVILSGWVVKTPVMEYTPVRAIPMTQFSILVPRMDKNRNFKSSGEVDFFNVRVFGETAEEVHDNIAKDDRAYLTGRLFQERWKRRTPNKTWSKERVLVEIDYIACYYKGGTKYEYYGRVFNAWQGDRPETGKERHPPEDDERAEIEKADIPVEELL